MPKQRYQLTYPACAKLNLTLDILGRRDDGYHNIATVMQTIDLCDRLVFTPLPEAEGAIELHCGRASLQNESNLVVRAAEAIQAVVAERTGSLPSVSIELRKRIPVAAGLGGGSSDAACTLLALNEAWNVGLSKIELSEIAATLGSDVPFFLHGGTMLAEGRGEKLTPLPSLPHWWVVLMRPPIHIPEKTRQLYSSLKPADYTGGQATNELVSLLHLKPEQEHSGSAEAHLSPAWWQQWENGANCFMPIWERLAPRLSMYRAAMLDAGASVVLLSGAGPTIFTLCETAAEAHAIQGALRTCGISALLARFCS